MTTTLSQADFLASLAAPLLARQVSCTSIRTRIRVELAAAVTAGLLPAGVKFSVRGDHNEITVDMIAWPGCPLNTTYTEAVMARARGDLSLMTAWDNDIATFGRWGMRRTDRRECTAAVNDALALVEVILNRHNYDDSDSMVDHFNVGYYTNVVVSVIDMATTAMVEECKPEIAAKRQLAIAASRRLGDKATRSICGHDGVLHCNEWALNQLIKLDALAAGNPVAYSKSHRRWLVTREAA